MHYRLLFLSLMLAVVTPSTIALIHQAESPALAQSASPITERLLNEGVQQYRHGLYRPALQTYQKLLAIQQAQNDRVGIGQTLNNLGETYIWLMEDDKAMELLQQSLVIRREVKDRHGEGETLDNIGFVNLRKNQYDKARDILQQALAIRREVKDQLGEAKTLRRLGSLYDIGFNQYPKALELLQQALAIQDKLDDQFEKSRTLLNIAKVYSELKNYPQALEWAQKSLILSRKIQNRSQESSALTLTGLLYSQQNQYGLARQQFQQALSVIHELEIYPQEHMLIMLIAGTYQKSDIGKQIELLQQSLAFARQHQLHSQELSSLDHISNLYAVRASTYITKGLTAHDIGKKIELLQQALAFARQHQLHSQELSSLAHISNLYAVRASTYITKGLTAQAKVESSRLLEVSQEALSLARVLKNRELEASALAHMGSAYINLNEPQKAIELLQQSVSIAREIKNLDAESSALVNLERIYLNQGKNDQLIEARLRHLEVAREQNDQLIEADALINLAATYEGIGEHIKAVETSQQAIATLQKIEITKQAPDVQYDILQSKFYALEWLSFSYGSLGQYDKAIDSIQQALKYAQTIHEPKLEAEALVQLGFLYSNTFNNFPKAIAVIQQALTIANQIKEPSLEARALQRLSDVYNKQGNFQKALDFANQLLAIAKRLENPKLENEALSSLQNIYEKQGNYQKALATAQENLTLLQKENIHNGNFTSLLSNISQIYVSLGDTVKALETAKQALSLARESRNPRAEALALLYVTLVYKAQGKYDQGIQTAQNSLEISQKNKDFSGEVAATVGLTEMYTALGEYQKVITLAEPNLTNARKINDRASEGQLLINLGRAYKLVGNYSRAKDLIEQGLKIARDLKTPRLESFALNSLGNYYISLQNYQQALSLTQQSLQIAQSLKIPPLLIDSQFTLGDIYSNLGDYKKSRELYQQALTTAQQLKNRESEGIALFAQGYTYFSQGEPQKTVELSQKALNIFQEIKVPRLEAFATRALSVGYGELGDDVKAMSAAQSFLAFTRKTQNSVWEKSALSLLASLHSKFGRKDQAIATYLQAIAIKTEPDTDAYNYAGLARIHRDLNQPSVAIKYYKESINRIQQFRHSIEGLPPELQNSFLEATVDLNHTKVSDIYRQLADLLLSQGREKEAFQVRLLIQNQELREATGYRSSTDKPNIPLTPNDAKIPTQSPSIIALANQIDECKRTNCPQSSELEERKIVAIKEFTKHLGEIDKEIRSNRANDDGFFDPKELGKAQNIVEAEPNTVMIYPLVLEKEMWVQLYGAKGVVKTLKIPVSREELGKTVKEFRNLMEYCQKTTCGVDETAKVKVVSQKLYNWLIKDLEPELQSNQVKNLVFALDRETRYIPMSTLYDGKQYLIEKYSIHNVLNQDYDKNARLPVGIQNTQILAMGLSNAVSKPSPGFRALGNVPKELDAIIKTNTNQGIFPGQKYLNAAFDLPTLQHNLEGHKILHLATHGVFDPTHPKESFILLGNGNELKPDDITTLTGLSDINLVVLSACQTALANRQQQDGIEINTLAFYFINRGAKSVMASLWEVDDGSTTTLMQQFYRNLAKATKQTPITKAEALRQAQLTLLRGQTTATGEARSSPELPTVNPTRPDTPTRKDTTKDPSHPYYWAPFILLGNGL